MTTLQEQQELTELDAYKKLLEIMEYYGTRFEKKVAVAKLRFNNTRENRIRLRKLSD